MSEITMRLGDLVDDYCPRCRLLLNHAVASMLEGQVVKVICQTCYTEHAFLHGKEKKKTSTRGQTLFDQVLANASPAAAPVDGSAKKKGAGAPTRYFSRHKTPPRGRKT